MGWIETSIALAALVFGLVMLRKRCADAARRRQFAADRERLRQEQRQEIMRMLYDPPPGAGDAVADAAGASPARIRAIPPTRTAPDRKPERDSLRHARERGIPGACA